MNPTKMTAVVVDDSPSIRLVLDTILDSLGIDSIKHCDSGIAALETISTTNSLNEIIFVDLNMPGMDGMELIRHLGKKKYQGGVVIVSGMDSKIIDLASDLAWRNKVHLIGSLTKPFNRDQLQHVLVKYDCLQKNLESKNEQLSKAELIRAMSENRVTPYYQPLIDSKTLQIKSLEVLARIDNPSQGGCIMPYQFISSAEKYHLIDSLCAQLAKKALNEFSDLKGIFGQQLKLAFNISPTQLEDLSIHKKFENLIELHGISPEQLIIEITEELALETPNQLESINRLKMKGYGIALDDYGTGFTNISQLRNLPLSEIKIDRSLVTGIESDPFSQAIVNSLVEISKTTDVDLVAEGIETHSEYLYLENLAVPVLLQGYLITKPKPLAELICWFNNWKKISFKQTTD